MASGALVEEGGAESDDGDGHEGADAVDAADLIEVVEEDTIVEAMRTTWERAKLPIEASAAVAVAVALRGGFAGKRVGVVLSGGNVDLTRLPWQRV